MAFVALAVALSPLWLGPMLVPIERAFAEAHHVCACGMAVGTCGCPECEALERQQRTDDSSPVPLLKGECDRGTTLLGAPHLPPPLLPAPPGVLLSAGVAVLDPPACPALASLASPPPPTPPPRLG